MEQIDEEKQRELEFISLRKSRGELLIDIKAVLQNMLAIMVCIKPGWGANQKSGKDGKKVRDKRKRMEKKKQKRRRDEIARKSSNDENYQLEKVHPDGEKIIYHFLPLVGLLIVYCCVIFMIIIDIFKNISQLW